MNRIVLLGTGLLGAWLLAAGPSRAAEPVTHNVTVPSTMRIEFNPDGSWKVDQRSVRFETYGAIPDDLRAGARFPPRLATIATATSGEIDDQNSSIAVAIDDMSGPALRRIAEFTDPGSLGTVLAGLFFVSTQPGCCALPPRHRIRALETGRALFGTTGGGEAGTVAWMQVPNARPTVERWVAFEGHVGAPGYGTDPTKVGDLLYGDRRGVLSRAVLRLKPGGGETELALDMASCGFLRWTEPGRARRPGRPARPAHGRCDPNGSYFPDALFSLEHRKPDQPLAGFGIELSVSGDVYVTIPIADDRFDLGHAKLDRRLVVVDVPTPR